MVAMVALGAARWLGTSNDPAGVIRSPKLDDATPAPGDNPYLWDLMHNMTGNMTNCTNDYCVPDDEYLDMIETYVFPTKYEWLLIAMHLCVFTVGLVGNALVCAAVYRNPGMRTVTNYFLANLAVADFLVILLCLPPTVLWDVTETWFMGWFMCKVVLYFQTVSVAVSVLTLTFISLERWYAICFPLQFRSTISRAKRAIIFIWALALLFDIPELVVLHTEQKKFNVDSVLLTQCCPSWTPETDMVFHCVKSLFLYFLPLGFMLIAYCQIARVLWDEKYFPEEGEVRLAAMTVDAVGRTGRTGQTLGHGLAQGRRSGWRVRTRSRRKAAKMLVAVVLLFAICYLPVHLLSILRYTMEMQSNEWTVAFSLLSHWLCYANSALNPLIYNFMSEKFRKEFHRTFSCRLWKGRGAMQAHAPNTRPSTRSVIVHLGRHSNVETVPMLIVTPARHANGAHGANGILEEEDCTNV
ncbi:orexin receptor type 1-like [Thrips palmi]|uniref:Orexin receptor type 1-like n=1 Tax=Thrips palmi TaxID=161013 RepID=A0A6P8YVU5_THRPL|nr:orexin receptor type 1-like [Thrips palmi]